MSYSINLTTVFGSFLIARIVLQVCVCSKANILPTVSAYRTLTKYSDVEGSVIRFDEVAWLLMRIYLNITVTKHFGTWFGVLGYYKEADYSSISSYVCRVWLDGCIPRVLHTFVRHSTSGLLRVGSRRLLIEINTSVSDRKISKTNTVVERYLG